MFSSNSEKAGPEKCFLSWKIKNLEFFNNFFQTKYCSNGKIGSSF